MCGRNLKNYLLYLEKIETYAQVLDIKIEHKTEPSDGVYIPTRRTIRIDPDLDESSDIATLLHELGHAIDDHFSHGGIDPKTEAAYRVVYNGNPSEAQLKLVVEAEKLAWLNGRKIAKALRIPLGKWYDDEEKDAIRLYKKS